VRVVDLPGLPSKGDVSDWLDAGGTPDQLREICRATPEWEPPEPDEAVAAPGAGGNAGQVSASERIVLDPKAPLASARKFIAKHYTIDGFRTLIHCDDQFFAYNGRVYPVIGEAMIRSQLYQWLDDADVLDRDGLRSPFKPTARRVSDIVDALRAETHRPSSVSAPAWLEEDPGQPPADEILPCKNGLLDLRARKLLPHTPKFYCQSALELDYSPNAPEPKRFLDFLDQLWPNDPESIDVLQMLFGYLLTSDTSLQKLFMIVGPKRSGKGTVGRVLTALLGQANVCGPTLSSLATNFGLSALIGKRLALISDARLSGRIDQSIVVERLLSISGEDHISVDRKYREPLTLKLPTRCVILSNELPRLADVSGALASRFIVLQIKESFFGREDHSLTDKLLAELPGILNWALDGLQRLREQGRFVQPQSSAEAIEMIKELSSPVAAFVRECCEVGPYHEVECKRLFELWKWWCGEQGRDRPGTEQTFGRDLRAVVPTLTVGRPWINGRRVRKYQGICVK